MAFAAEAFASWLQGQLANADIKLAGIRELAKGRQRSLRRVATAAVLRTAADLDPEDDGHRDHLAAAIDQLFAKPVPYAAATGSAALRDIIQTGVARQLSPLSSSKRVGADGPLDGLPGVSAATLAKELTWHLLQEVSIRGVSGSPLMPLASALSQDQARMHAHRGQKTGIQASCNATGGRAPRKAAIGLPPINKGKNGKDKSAGVTADENDRAPDSTRFRKRMRELFSNIWMVTIAGGLIVAIVSGLVLARLFTQPDPSPARFSGGIPAGFYVDGKPGTPHWFMQLTTGPGNLISGTVSFVYQDGQTGLSQTFSGHVQQGLSTLTLSGAGVRTASVGSDGHRPELFLGECAHYLKYITSVSQCHFVHAVDIQGDEKSP
jgi:hypothetical protein